MGSVHEELYARVYALFTQDLDATRGLSNSSSTAYCRGGMYRAGDPQRTMNPPWIEVSIGIDEDMNSPDGTICVATVDLRIHGNRDKKYTGNGGDSILNTVAQRVREVYNDCAVEKGATADKYRISSFKRVGGGLAGVGDKDLVLSERYRVLVTEKGVGLFHLWSGGAKQFLRGGFSDENRHYIALDIGDLEAPNNDVPHPGYTDRLSIVKSVTRVRVFNKWDAEYAVNYKPLDFSFDEQQRRTRVTQDVEEQEVPLYKRLTTSDPETGQPQVSWSASYKTFKRATFTRTEQVKRDIGRTIDTDPLIDLMTQIAADTNKIRVIGNVPYLFQGAEVEYNTVTGIALVSAVFWTIGPVKAKSRTSSGGVVWDVGLPALGYLENYQVTEPKVSGGRSITDPLIQVVPYIDDYEIGGFAWLL